VRGDLSVAPEYESFGPTAKPWPRLTQSKDKLISF